MKKVPHRVWMAIGLLFISAAIGFKALFPSLAHGDAGDFWVGVVLGIGLGLELFALWKMRRDRRGA